MGCFFTTMNINAKSEKYGLIGFPTSHSLSPIMHNANFQALNNDAFYFAYEIKPDSFSTIAPTLSSLFKGFNITVPYKEQIIPFLSKIDDSAKLIKAVNTVKCNEGKMTGTNTDWSGFRDSLVYDYEQDIINKKWLIIGAGGASRSAVYAAIQEKATEITIVNRTIEKAHQIAEDFKEIYNISSITIDQLPDITKTNNFDLIINTTSIGLKKGDIHFFDFNWLNNPMAFAYDMIYSIETDFLKKAEKSGFKTGTGMGMLARQGANAYEYWFNNKPDINIFLNTLNK